MPADLLWTLLSLFLTLMVFSYLLGDNPLFRVAAYLFVGVAAGVVATLAVYEVLLARLLFPLINGDPATRLLTLVPLALSLLLVAKLLPRFSGLGSVPMAYLAGTGAAVAISGALFGTLIGQSQAMVNGFDLGAASGQSPLLRLIEGAVLLVGAVTTLAYFNFSGRNRPGDTASGETQGVRPVLAGRLAAVGQFFIAITLGAFFAGVYISALSALVDRVGFLGSLFSQLQSLVR